MIFSAIAYSQKRKQEEANIASITSAIGFSGVFTALGGKDTKVSPQDILPFPDTKEEKRMLSDCTASILKRLYKQGELPPEFWGAIANVLSEL